MWQDDIEEAAEEEEERDAFMNVRARVRLRRHVDDVLCLGV